MYTWGFYSIWLLGKQSKLVLADTVMFKFHVGQISRKFVMLIGLEILAEFHEASKQAKQDKFIFWTCGLLTLGDRYHPCMVKLFCFTHEKFAKIYVYHAAHGYCIRMANIGPWHHRNQNPAPQPPLAWLPVSAIGKFKVWSGSCFSDWWEGQGGICGTENKNAMSLCPWNWKKNIRNTFPFL